MELVVAVFIWCWLQAASEVYWIVSNKPVIYGENIILTCKTRDVLTDRGGACQVRQWFSGRKLLLYNDVPIDATRYEGGTNLSSTAFSLVIKNYTESDLNINYTCSCGFDSYTRSLALSDNNFIIPPLRVDTNIQQFNETLSIYIHVERVYHRPQCSVVIGERTVFDNLTITSVKRGVFYYGTYEASFNIVDDDCGKKPTLFCYIGNEYNIVNTSGEPIRNCTVHNFNIHWIVSNKPVVYGDNIILTCKTYRRGACLVRQWYGGPTNKLLLYNNWSVDGKKYENRTNLSSTEISLVIKNYTESDLNINYACSCGFKSYTTRHDLSDNNFIVYWIVSNKPVIYGENIILTCKTRDVLTDRGDACQVRQWYSGRKLLLYNDVAIDATRYEGGTNLSSTAFSLVIKNYTESDLNINYTCSCGFKSYTTRLDLSDNNFIVPPLRVDTDIKQSNETLSIYIHVERVYHRPECSVVIGERTVFDKLTLTSVKRGEFYYGTYEANFNIVDDDCGKKPTLLCYIGNEYNIVDSSGEQIRNCIVRDYGGNMPGYTSIPTEAYITDIVEVIWSGAYTQDITQALFGVILTLVALVCLIGGCTTFYERKVKKLLMMVFKGMKSRQADTQTI